MVKMPHWPNPIGYKVVDLELSRIKRFLKLLGNPEKKLPPIVHVSGTNGKGSTLAYLKAIFEAANYKVHRYISPHLLRFNERIMLSGKEINDNDLFKYIEYCRIVAESDGLFNDGGNDDVRDGSDNDDDSVDANRDTNSNNAAACTFFESTTAMAFYAFADVKADVLLLEVGMGGRLDATNVIDSSMLSIITPISYDHMEYLGDTLSLIAKEKAGIIKQNSCCVISWQNPEAMNVLKNRCVELNVAYFAYGEQWDIVVDGDVFYVKLNINNIKDIDVINAICDRYSESNIGGNMGPFNQSLFGIHQILNAATAIVAAFILKIKKYQMIAEDNIKYGVSHTYWPARMERITKGKLYEVLPVDWELWLDGAHNNGGIEMVVATINNMNVQNYLPFYVVNGRTEKRDIQGFLHCLHDATPELICCVAVKYEPKSENPHIIQDIAQKMGFNAIVANSLVDALRNCINDASVKKYTKARILICGSLYLAADVLDANADASDAADGV